MTTSQPVVPGTIVLTSSGVQVLSPPPDATDIVDAGQPVQLRLNLSVTGLPAIVAMYANEPVQIKHHLELIETGARKTLGPFNFVTPAPAGLASFSFTTGPFTSGLGVGDFQTAPGDDDGTYRVITEFHFVAAGARANSVFDDRIVVVTAP